MRLDAWVVASLMRHRVGRGCDSSSAASVLHMLSTAAMSSTLICLLFFVLTNGAFCAQSLPPPTCSTRPLPLPTPTTRPQSSLACLTRPLPPSTQTCPARPSPPPPTMPAELDDRFVLYKKNKKNSYISNVHLVDMGY